MCKFYAGAEDKLLERRLNDAFSFVARTKPQSSRKVGLFCSIRCLLFAFCRGGGRDVTERIVVTGVEGELLCGSGCEPALR